MSTPFPILSALVLLLGAGCALGYRNPDGGAARAAGATAPRSADGSATRTAGDERLRAALNDARPYDNSVERGTLGPETQALLDAPTTSMIANEER